MDRPAQLVRQIAAQSASVDAAMAVLAGRQHGIVSRWRLLALGMSRDQVHDRVAGSQLHQIRRSHLLEPEANLLVEGELDHALWRQERALVEIDGFAFPKSRAQLEADR